MLNLLDHLKIESSVNLSVQKIREKQLANLYESLIGAIYLDGGIKPCRNLILQTVWAHKEDAWKATNYKGKLIEYCHSHDIGNPIFKIKDISGPDHQKTFEIQVKIGKEIYTSGFGTNKKTAEQFAAQNALDEMGVAV
jgi:ribonuclease-3